MSGTKIAVGRGNMKGFTCAEQLVKAEMIRTDNSETLENALLRIKAFEEQIEKMKCCENCKYKDCNKTSQYQKCWFCKNKNKWELAE